MTGVEHVHQTVDSSPACLRCVHVQDWTGVLLYIFLQTGNNVFVTFMWDLCTFEGPVCNI